MVRKLEAPRRGRDATDAAVEIREPADFGPLDRALAQLRAGEWDWLVFTSANGVHALLRRLEALGRDLRDLGGVKLAAIGPKTAEALREYRLRADVVPEATYSSEGLGGGSRTGRRRPASLARPGQSRPRACFATSWRRWLFASSR